MPNREPNIKKNLGEFAAGYLIAWWTLFGAWPSWRDDCIVEVGNHCTGLLGGLTGNARLVVSLSLIPLVAYLFWPKKSSADSHNPKGAQDRGDTLHNHTSTDTAVRVDSVAAEYDYIKAHSNGRHLQTLRTSLMEEGNAAFEAHHLLDTDSSEEFTIIFDVTSFQGKDAERLDDSLHSRRMKDEVYVTNWLKRHNVRSPQLVWMASYSKTEQAYELLQELGKLSIPDLRDNLGLTEDEALALLVRFHYRGWVRDENTRHEYPIATTADE